MIQAAVESSADDLKIIPTYVFTNQGPLVRKDKKKYNVIKLAELQNHNGSLREANKYVPRRVYSAIGKYQKATKHPYSPQNGDSTEFHNMMQKVTDLGEQRKEE